MISVLGTCKYSLQTTKFSKSNRSMYSEGERFPNSKRMFKELVKGKNWNDQGRVEGVLDAKIDEMVKVKKERLSKKSLDDYDFEDYDSEYNTPKYQRNYATPFEAGEDGESESRYYDKDWKEKIARREFEEGLEKKIPDVGIADFDYLDELKIFLDETIEEQRTFLQDWHTELAEQNQVELLKKMTKAQKNEEYQKRKMERDGAKIDKMVAEAPYTPSQKEKFAADPNYMYYKEIDWYVSKKDLRRDVVRHAIAPVLKNGSMTKEQKKSFLQRIITNLERAERVPAEKAQYIRDLYDSVRIPAYKLIDRPTKEKDTTHGLRLPYKHSEVFDALEHELDPEILKVKYEEAKE